MNLLHTFRQLLYDLEFPSIVSLPLHFLHHIFRLASETVCFQFEAMVRPRHADARLLHRPHHCIREDGPYPYDDTEKASEGNDEKDEDHEEGDRN